MNFIAVVVGIVAGFIAAVATTLVLGPDTASLGGGIGAAAMASSILTKQMG